MRHALFFQRWLHNPNKAPALTKFSSDFFIDCGNLIVTNQLMASRGFQAARRLSPVGGLMPAIWRVVCCRAISSNQRVREWAERSDGFALALAQTLRRTSECAGQQHDVAHRICRVRECRRCRGLYRQDLID